VAAPVRLSSGICCHIGFCSLRVCVSAVCSSIWRFTWLLRRMGFYFVFWLAISSRYQDRMWQRLHERRKVTYKWNYADLALNVLVCSLLVVTTCVAAYRLSRRLHWPLKLAISDVFQILTCVAILLAFCNTYRLPGSSVHASPLQWHPWLWFQPWYVQSAALIGLVSCIYCSVLVTCLLARWFLNLLIQHLLPVERQVIDV
jgi:hypothetical protein